MMCFMRFLFPRRFPGKALIGQSSQITLQIFHVNIVDGFLINKRAGVSSDPSLHFPQRPAAGGCDRPPRLRSQRRSGPGNLVLWGVPQGSPVWLARNCSVALASLPGPGPSGGSRGPGEAVAFSIRRSGRAGVAVSNKRVGVPEASSRLDPTAASDSWTSRPRWWVIW